MQRKTKLWQYIIAIYKERLGIPEDIVELLSVINILEQSVEGLSNKVIAECTGTSLEYIKETLEQFLSFSGWSVDLDFSPIKVYNRTNGFNEYINEIILVSPLSLPLDVSLSYEICKKYIEMENKIEKYDY
jgi:hypothetical protein